MEAITYKEFKALEDGEEVEAIKGTIKKVFPRTTGRKGEYKWSVQNVYLDIGGKDDVKLAFWNREELKPYKGKRIAAWKNDDEDKGNLLAKVDDEYGTSLSVERDANFKMLGAGDSEGKSSDDDGGKKSSRSKVDTSNPKKVMADIINLYNHCRDAVNNVVNLPDDADAEEKRSVTATIFLAAKDLGLVGLVGGKAKDADEEPEEKKSEKSEKSEPEDDGPGGEEDDGIPF